MKKIVLLAFVLTLLSTAMLGTRLVITVSVSTTHHVYPGESIQDAINSAQPGDTIFVHNGTYIENVVVNKSISLIGENRTTTIIDGNYTGNVMNITANNVNITGFTIRKSGTDEGEYGIYLYSSSGNNISHNIVTDNWAGICLDNSSSNTLTGNTISLNNYDGLRLLDSSDDNTVSDNIVSNNGWGISLQYCNNNVIFHNNFNNRRQHSCWESNNTWDNGYPSGGNFWTNYEGVDEYSGENQDEPGSDGIGDTPHVIVPMFYPGYQWSQQDKYPLMNPWGVHQDAEPPTADAGPDQSVAQGMIVFFDGSESTDNLGIRDYTWTFLDVTPKTLTGVNPTYRFTHLGNFEVTLNVTDYAGHWDTDKMWVNVSEPAIINVPANFSTIQEAVNAAEPGDIVQVTAATYYEHVILNKTVRLIGQEVATTIIDGNSTGSPVLEVRGIDVEITGFTVQHGGCGIYLTGLHSLMRAHLCNIHGNIVRDNGYGIFLEGVIEFYTMSNNTIAGNIVKNNTYGIALLEANENTIAGNNVSNNRDGIALGGRARSGNNVIVGNNVSNNYGGISLTRSGSNELRNNNMTNNTVNFGVIGQFLSHFLQDIDTSNTVDGKLIYYLADQNNLMINSSRFPNIGYLGLVNSKNITVMDLNPKKNAQGVLFAYTENSTLMNVNASENLFGIYLVESNNNTIANNFLSNNLQGIALGKSNHNILIGNMIKNNSDGIVLSSSDNNTVYHNNFIHNHVQVDVWGNNTWDNGYPSGGNYWSDYADVDLCSGPYQDEHGSDGIGDKSYVIDTDNIDVYPLMGPISFFNAGTWNETTYYVHTVSNSTVSDFNFDPDNYLISFNVTGTEETVGFCRVTIPNELLWCDEPDQWEVWVNNTLIENRKIIEDTNRTYIYFTYNQSTQNVEVIGVHVIPEFPTLTSTLLILTVLTVAIAIYKRKSFCCS